VAGPRAGVAQAPSQILHLNPTDHCVCVARRGLPASDGNSD
jgi:hypothetical protein